MKYYSGADVMSNAFRIPSDVIVAWPQSTLLHICKVTTLFISLACNSCYAEILVFLIDLLGTYTAFFKSFRESTVTLSSCLEKGDARLYALAKIFLRLWGVSLEY